MKYFSTLSDYNYLPLGFSLYESLKNLFFDNRKNSKKLIRLYYDFRI